MWFLAQRNKFCQRLVASAEGPFTTVCIITRPPDGGKPTKCSDISSGNSASILSTTCDTRLPIPLSAFGIDLTLPLPWPDSSFGTLHLLLEPRFHPTPKFDLWEGKLVNSSIFFGVSKMPARDKIRSTSFSESENLQFRKWLEMSF